MARAWITPSSMGSSDAIDMHNRLISPILHFVPLEVVAIVHRVVWLVMGRRHFKKFLKSHCIAVAFAIANAGLWDCARRLALRKAGRVCFRPPPNFGEELAIYGLIALSQGALLVSMFGSRNTLTLLDRRSFQLRMVLQEPFSPFRLIHAYELIPRESNKLEFLPLRNYDQLCRRRPVSGGCHLLTFGVPFSAQNSNPSDLARPTFSPVSFP